MNRGRVVGDAQIGSGGKGCPSGRIQKDISYAFVTVWTIFLSAVYIMLRISSRFQTALGAGWDTRRSGVRENIWGVFKGYVFISGRVES